MNDIDQRCIACDQSSDQTPLILFHYRSQDYYICPQHLPLLIHKPEQLAGKLPGLVLSSTTHHHED